LASRMKIVVEPTGCLGFAAALERKAQLRGRRVGVLISGGNVDMERFCSLINGQGTASAPSGARR
jgi:threonine dehydratase